MQLLLQLVRGFLVGVAGLLPGLCGSTLLVLFKMYRPLTAALAHPFADFRGNLIRFGPFFLAAGAGLLAGTRALAGIFARHETAAVYLFMGFMGGTLPGMVRHARRVPGGWPGRIAFAAMLLLCLGLAVLQDRLLPRGEPLAGRWGVWLLAGAGIGLGSIVPGASVAFILIYFGLYQPMLDGVGRLEPGVLLPVVIGAAGAVVLFSRVMHWLFHRAEGPVARGVLGLVAGSLILAFPGFPLGENGLQFALLFGAGWLLSGLLERLAPPAEA